LIDQQPSEVDRHLAYALQKLERLDRKESLTGAGNFHPHFLLPSLFPIPSGRSGTEDSACAKGLGNTLLLIGCGFTRSGGVILDFEWGEEGLR
jgi:hypothetical protein